MHEESIDGGVPVSALERGQCGAPYTEIYEVSSRIRMATGCSLGKSSSISPKWRRSLCSTRRYRNRASICARYDSAFGFWGFLPQMHVAARSMDQLVAGWSHNGSGFIAQAQTGHDLVDIPDRDDSSDCIDFATMQWPALGGRLSRSHE